ncbi:2Fe-2S iron-sulfur cluster-binding protein [Chelativorans alearense]|uniref:2Fe-2S iron-sulfur cluster-binding protein n=1 Tax=Chelativorans alearense TaxID=2681495 RepID=UPI0013D67C0B|nr:2Fe-2S iron-sulfur cluster-binding protein [Chelativorans alearense]
MPRVTYRLPDGRDCEVELSNGQSLMEGAIRNGIGAILGECGGSAMCATCHVYIEGGPVGALPSMCDDEDAMLEEAAAERLGNSRLSCQIRMNAALDGIVVRVPEEM